MRQGDQSGHGHTYFTSLCSTDLFHLPSLELMSLNIYFKISLYNFNTENVLVDLLRHNHLILEQPMGGGGGRRYTHPHLIGVEK